MPDDASLKGSYRKPGPEKGSGLGTRNDLSAPSARSQKHLCGKRTCAGCMVCADPGPRGECGPCGRNVTRVTKAQPCQKRTSDPRVLALAEGADERRQAPGDNDNLDRLEKRLTEFKSDAANGSFRKAWPADYSDYSQADYDLDQGPQS